ncbi:MAG: hypothetical protein HKN30_16840 [Sulfitobacter sp.]|nr:hypothetical protein [Sulfitobacter sp.]
MLVFLCNPGDVMAGPFVAELRRRHRLAAQIITPQELVYAPDMQHLLGEAETYSAVTLKTHGTLENASITGLVNRVDFLPDAHLANVNAADRTYIQQELLAIWSSWISALPCPVLNRPTAISIAGPVYHPAIWHHYAAAVGLPVAQVIYDADLPDPQTPAPVHSAIVCQGVCYSPTLPRELFAACCELAAYAGLDMVELLFGSGPGGTVFSHASPIPDLSQANANLIAQVAEIFRDCQT